MTLSDSPTHNGAITGANDVIKNGDNGVRRTMPLEEVEIKSGRSEHSTECGFFRWRPKLLHYCNNKKIMLAVMCWFAAIQGFAVNGINNVNTTSLERRFFLSSTQVSLISSSYDIAAGIFVIPIGYFGRLGHKPRWLGFAALCMACGSFVMTLPHFVTSQYIADTNVTDTCPAESGLCEGSGLSNFLYVFMLGQFLHGLGGTTLYTLGVTYIHENVKMHSSPVYIGIFEAFAAFGPAIGYLLGGLFLDIYVDFDSLPAGSVTIGSGDPRWVGAWWIGFLISMSGFLTIAFMMFLFGWELPEAAENRRTWVSQAHDDASREKFARPDFGLKLKDLPQCTFLLLKNPAFIFLTAGGVLGSLCTSGMATFLPKFIQTQFSVSPSWSALLTGFVVIPGGILGQLAGGVIPGKLKWGVKAIIRYMAVVMFVAALTVPAFYLRCAPNTMAGVTHQYLNSSASLDSVTLTDSCNMNCNCTTKTREPVCDSLNVEYFSACYAGCTGYRMVNESKIYTGCSCTSAPGQEVQAGQCAPDCTFMPLFLVLLFVIVFCILLTIPAGVVTSIRCVPDNQGAFALALQWVFVRFLATIPGPILYGAIVDRTCIVWQDRCETADGSCWQFNQRNLAINFMSINLSLCILIVISYVIAQFVYRPPGEKNAEDVGDGEVNPGFVSDNDLSTHM